MSGDAFAQGIGHLARDVKEFDLITDGAGNKVTLPANAAITHISQDISDYPSVSISVETPISTYVYIQVSNRALLPGETDGDLVWQTEIIRHCRSDKIIQIPTHGRVRLRVILLNDTSDDAQVRCIACGQV